MKEGESPSSGCLSDGKASWGVIVVIVVVFCSTTEVTLEEPLVSMSVVKVEHDSCKAE